MEEKNEEKFNLDKMCIELEDDYISHISINFGNRRIFFFFFFFFF